METNNCPTQLTFATAWIIVSMRVQVATLSVNMTNRNSRSNSNICSIPSAKPRPNYAEDTYQHRYRPFHDLRECVGIRSS